MTATLAAVAYVWIAQAVAFLLVPRAIPLGRRARALAFWALSAVVVLTLKDTMAILLAVAALMLVLSPLSTVQRAAFYLVAVPAVPVFITVILPFPGINYLTLLTHYKLASLVLLLPVLFSHDRSAETRPTSLTGPSWILIAYVLYTTVLVALPDNFTGGLRVFLDQLLTILVPYLAILIAVRKTEDVDAFFQAFLIASVILAMVALISSAKHWDIYASSASLIAEIRGGTLRINATAGTHSLAFHFAAAILVLEFLKRRLAIGWVQLNLMRVVLFAGMLPTDSRGALGGLAVALAVYIFLSLRNTALRTALFLALASAAVVGVLWLAEGNVNEYDEHGTFIYRQELLKTSIEYVQTHLFFGDRNFLNAPEFQYLRQGQGIIDITNLYLQVALTYGLIGLGLFAGVFVLPPLAMGWALLRASRSADPTGAAETWFRATAVTVAIVAGWLFLVGTTSDVGLSMYLGVVFVALCQALRRVRPVVRVPVAPTAAPQPGNQFATA